MATESSHLTLVDGGPLDRLALRIGLVRLEASGVSRATLLVVLAWVPQLVLAALSGHSVLRLWLGDFANHARLLGAVPILVVAERFVDARVKQASRRFGSELVRPEDRPRFEASVVRLNQLTASSAVEISLVLVSFGLALLRGLVDHQAPHNNWYSLSGGGSSHPTAPQIWNLSFGLPLFFFLMLRWLWRYGLWVAFLVRMSRLKLRLVTSHPDRNAGLGFLSLAQMPFGAIPLTISLIASSTWARAVYWFNADLMQERQPAIMLVVVMLLIFVLPLVAFAPQLWRLRIEGVDRFDTFSSKFGAAFDDKWLVERPAEPPLTQDVQSLADAGNSFAMVHSVKLVPFERRLIYAFVAFTAAPMLFPLAMTVPLIDLAKKLAGALV